MDTNAPFLQTDLTGTVTWIWPAFTGPAVTLLAFYQGRPRADSASGQSHRPEADSPVERHRPERRSSRRFEPADQACGTRAH